MSVRVMSLVWDSTVPSPERLTLLALADRADEEGRCWPSVPTLAKKCRLGESTVRRHLTALADMGVLRVVHRMNCSSVYTIDLARLRELAEPEPPSNVRATPPDPSQSGRPNSTSTPPNVGGLPDRDPSQCERDPSRSEQSTPPNLSGDPSQSERLSIIDPSVDPSRNRQGARERAARATRIPDDFAVTAEMVEWARLEVPHVDGRRETEKFVDYWRAASGSNARKNDWPAAWRNWMRKADEQLPRHGPNVAYLPAAGIRPSTADQRFAANMALAASYPEEA